MDFIQAYKITLENYRYKKKKKNLIKNFYIGCKAL